MKVNILPDYLSLSIWLVGSIFILKNYLGYADVGGFCLGWAPGCLPMELINIGFGVILLAWTLLILGINLLFKYLRSRKTKSATK